MLKVLSFRVAGELFGIWVTTVKEINRNIEYTAVPRSPGNIAGLFNMRGQIVTLFNLAAMLGYDVEVKPGKVSCIILKSETGSPNQRGFIIERTGDVIDVSEEMCELPPVNLKEAEVKYFKAVVR